MNREEIQKCINNNLSFVILLESGSTTPEIYEIIVDQNTYQKYSNYPKEYCMSNHLVHFVLEEEYFKIVPNSTNVGDIGSHGGVEKMIRYNNIAGFFKFNTDNRDNARTLWKQIKKTMNK